MKLTALLLLLCVVLDGCSSYPETKFPELTLVLFNGAGERVEVEYDGKIVVSLACIRTDENNVAAVQPVRRGSRKAELLVKRNGVVAGRFRIDPRRMGSLFIFLTSQGSVIISDGDRMPPLV